MFKRNFQRFLSSTSLVLLLLATNSLVYASTGYMNTNILNQLENYSIFYTSPVYWSYDYNIWTNYAPVDYSRVTPYKQYDKYPNIWDNNKGYQSQPSYTESPSNEYGSDLQETFADTTSLSPDEIEMVQYVNQAREQAGLLPLDIDEDLSYVAKIKSQDMMDNNYFSHTSPIYGSPFEMMDNFGIQYKSAAENIAINSSVRGAHDAFMNSEGHRNNILNPNITHIGIGIHGQYFTQMFIQK